MATGGVALAVVALACTFVPPPPLPEEAAAQEAKERARVQALRAGEGTRPPTEGEAPSGTEAAAAAGADPEGGEFTLEEAVAGLAGEGELWVRFETERGNIECRLLTDVAPVTVANFVGLARGIRPFYDPDTGKWEKRPYYDGTTFHRVIPGFMIQGGDPKGTGEGNAGYTIVDEISPDELHDQAGVLSMANRGPRTGSSQFFITLGPTPHLDGKHTIFGRCTEAGVRVADDISMTPRDGADRPEEPETVRHVEIFRRPASGEGS